jgi:hypothetical protein
MSPRYTLEVTEIEDDLEFNPSGVGYRVSIFDYGTSINEDDNVIGDGVALDLRAATIEALEQAGII